MRVVCETILASVLSIVYFSSVPVSLFCLRAVFVSALVPTGPSHPPTTATTPLNMKA